MSTVSDELQVTIPRDVAERSGIRPGDEVTFVPERDGVRVLRVAASPRAADAANPSAPSGPLAEMFERFRERQRANPTPPAAPGADRGWTREELYEERVGRWVR